MKPLSIRENGFLKGIEKLNNLMHGVRDKAQEWKMTKTFRIGGELEVSRMGFGAMQITGPKVWGWPGDRNAINTLLRRVVELGIQFIDTADSYGPETSEYLLAEALHPYDDLLITTKGGYERSGPGIGR